MEKQNPTDDLVLTVQELGNAYEELSLLYRISDVFSSMSVDEICERIVDESIKSLNVRTAAVLFLDEKKGHLYTKISKGDWDIDRIYSRDGGIFWKVLEGKKSSAICSLKESEHGSYLPELSSLMVCPMSGKEKHLGVVVVADKVSSGEFYSNDSKLLTAICVQAGLAIENAFLYKELETLLLGAIGSLVRALEASSNWTAGHTERVTEYALGIGRAMGLTDDQIDRLTITSLLHDIGKIGTPKEILNKEDTLSEAEWLEIKKHPHKGAEILRELRQFEDIILGIQYHHEYWDGSRGIFGLKEQEIPLMARVLAVADTFDALTSDRPYRARRSHEEAFDEIIRCSGSQFDPAVVEAFISWYRAFSQQH